MKYQVAERPVLGERGHVVGCRPAKNGAATADELGLIDSGGIKRAFVSLQAEER